MISSLDRAGYGRLFAALESGLGVSFVERRAGQWRDVDAALILDGDLTAAESAAAAGLPSLVWLGSSRQEEGVVALGHDEHLASLLRGARLTDKRGAGDGVPLRDGDVVIASCNGAPRWTLRGDGAASIELVGLPLRPLGDDEALRDGLKAGQFLSLLPLVHFLRRMTRDHGWAPPPLRAAFIFDDPNLHWPTYGHVRYEQIAQQAEQHDFHAAMAMIPLDGWFAHPAAARTFRGAKRYLSLAVHGNDHLRGELTRVRSDAEALRIAGQALRRMTAFERRSGVEVSRVMVPPHGGCSPMSLGGLSRVGFEAQCGTRARAPDTPGWADRPLADWEPAELGPGGLPLFTRHSLHREPDDLLLRAYLGQPLLVYSHHDALSGGPDILSRAAAKVRALGVVRWGSLTEIARSNFATRREGTILAVRLFCRRAAVPIPEGVQGVRVELPDSARSVHWTGVRCGGSHLPLSSGPGPRSTDPLAVSPHQTLEVFADVEDQVDVGGVAPSRTALWPIVRRGLTEGRDRLAPLAPVLSRRPAGLARPGRKRR